MLRRFVQYLVVFLMFPWPHSLSASTLPGYQNIPWDSSFPRIEKEYPEVKFIEEDSYHVVTFALNQLDQPVKRLEFRLFEEKLQFSFFR